MLKRLRDSKISNIIDHLYEKRDYTLEQIITITTADDILDANTYSDAETKKKKKYYGDAFCSGSAAILKNTMALTRA